MAGSMSGVVADNKDPQGLSRVRVQIPTESGPQISEWADPSAGPGSLVPKVGTPVTVIDGGSWSQLTYLSIVAGQKGASGVNGSDGSDGSDGQDGTDGLNGIDGLPGADGILALTNGIIHAEHLAEGAVIAGKIATNAVDGAAIAAAAITASKLAAGAVTGAAIAGSSIDVTKLADGSVSASKLLDNSVTTAKLVDNAISTAKIQPLAIDSSLLAAGSVVTGKIAPLSITTLLIADGAITSTTIAPLAITAPLIAPLAIDNSKIATGAVTSDSIASNSITSDKVAANAITAGAIAANSVTADALASNSVVAGKIAANAITAGTISGSAVTAGSIAANAVVAGNIDSAAVTAGTIAANAVTAGKIAADAITAREIAANAITASELAAGSVTANAIAANSIYAEALQANSVLAHNIGANAITAGKIDSDAISANNITANAISSVHIQADAINATHISAGAIGADEIAANAIVAGKIAANAIAANEIAAGSISAAKMVTGTITAASGIIANAAIGSAQIRDAAIDSAKIAGLAVGTAAIADAAIVNAKIGTAAILEANIADAAIGEAKIRDASIISAKIGDLQVTSAKITSLSVTSLKLGESAITNTKIATEAIDARTIRAGSITTDRLTVGVNNNLIKDQLNSDVTIRLQRYVAMPGRWTLVGPGVGGFLDGGWYFRIGPGAEDSVFSVDNPVPLYALQNVQVGALIRRETPGTNGQAILAVTITLSSGEVATYNVFPESMRAPIGVTAHYDAALGSAAYVSTSEWRTFRGVVACPEGTVSVQMTMVITGCSVGAWQLAAPEMAIVSDTIQSAAYEEGGAGYRFSSDVSQVEDLNVLNELSANQVNASSYLLDGEDLFDQLTAFADGLYSFGDSSGWSQDSAQATFATEAAIAFLATGEVVPSRYYQLFYGMTLKDTTVADSVWRTRIRYTSDGTTPTTASPVLDGSAYDAQIPKNGSFGMRVNHNVLYTPGSTHTTLRMLLTLQQITAGGSTVFVEGTSGETQLQMAFVDTGAKADVGGVVTQQSFFTSGSPTTPVYASTASYPALWARSFKGDDSYYSAITDPILGYVDAVSGQSHSLLGFGDLSGPLTGATVTMLQLKFKVKSTVAAYLRTVIPGYHNYATAGAATSFAHSGSGVIYQLVGGGHKAGSTYTVTLYDSTVHAPASPQYVLMTNLVAGTAKGVTLGPLVGLTPVVGTTTFYGGTYYGYYSSSVQDSITDPVYAGSIFGVASDNKPQLLVSTTQ